ncbi:arginyl-tRNA--protein transferase 1-like isoform X1 [Saccostrea cucullata]|uniref:arginyl-tRNA--protein transferase 1-like isoform X1 n=1 Tax=Saccostrea cuccullata TaxID=36930 RepID=UPI002ED20BFF
MADSVGPGIVEWYGGGDRPGHRCGYCKSSDTNVSDGMWAHALTVQDYQDLIDRGWRRSGKYCYKPKMDTTCCPHYTIKMGALDFKMSKSHKKIIKQFNKFIIHGKKRGEHETEEDGMGETEGGGLKGAGAEKGGKKKGSGSHDSSGKEKVMETDKDRVETETSQVKGAPKPGLGADPNKPKCKKAKELRKERKLAKQSYNPQPEKQPSQKQKNSGEKTLEDLLNEPDQAESCAHKLEVKLVRVNPPSSEFEDTHEESYGVFKRYQMGIHHEEEWDCSEDQFDQFLCEGPLQEEYKEGRLPMGYGSFHQQYWLDGQIIAVGVIDILPNCVSSVYLYYHPDYDFLSLGTYSALREIAFVRELNKKDPDLTFYYMGYYIHSCPKMKYKGQYYPSYLLCPEVYSWHPIEECAPKLDQNRYSRFAEPGKEDEEGKVELDKVMILHKRMAMTYEQYKLLNPRKQTTHDNVIRKYSSFVGRSCATRMLLYRD